MSLICNRQQVLEPPYLFDDVSPCKRDLSESVVLLLPTERREEVRAMDATRWHAVTSTRVQLVERVTYRL